MLDLPDGVGAPTEGEKIREGLKGSGRTRRIAPSADPAVPASPEVRPGPPPVDPKTIGRTGNRPLTPRIG